MDNTAENENLRQSYRCPVDRSRRNAQLRVGGEWTPVELLDKSAGGFGIESQQPLDVSVGQQVQLRVGDECFETRVMRLEEQPAQSGQDASTILLGLKRLGEVYTDEVKPQPWLALLKRTRRRRPFSSTGTFLTAALIFAFFAGVTPVVIIYMRDSQGISGVSANGSGVKSVRIERPPKTKQTVSDRSSTEAAINADAPNRKTSAQRLPQFDIFRSGATGNRSPADKRNASFLLLFDHARLRGKIGQWSHEFLAAIAELAEKIGLTLSQKHQVDSLLRQTDAEIARLDEPNPDYTPQKVAIEKKSILEVAYEKLMLIFTPAQRNKWDLLVEEWSRAGNAAAAPHENSAD